MQEKIVVKWFSEKHSLGVTAEKEVYFIRGKDFEICKAVYHMGRKHFLIPKTSKRISDLQINKTCKKKEILLQDYCPF